jgi:hypothetical protein
MLCKLPNLLYIDGYMKYLLALFFCSITILAQAQKKKFYFPAWTFHQKNATIVGISAGLASGRGIEPTRTNTYGLRLEVPGAGILVGLIPESPLAETDSAFRVLKQEPVSEKVYGFSVSALGTVCNCIVNGISVGGIGQIQYKVNGISFSPISFAQVHNGLQLGAFNYTYKMNGIQIGFVNTSMRTRGIQIGIINRNEKRTLPLINWNFN